MATLSRMDGFLSVQSPLWRLDPQGGHMQLSSSIHRFSMDVGVNKGICTRSWLEASRDTFVVGIEANALLVSMLTKVEMKNQPQSYVSWHQSVKSDLKSMELAAKAIAKESRRVLIINAAAGRGGGVKKFYTGDRADDTGSLFKPRGILPSSSFVPVVALEDVLQYVPTYLKWDTLKIDVQGADVEALLSAGSHVAKFRCVVGEFDGKEYDVPEHIERSPVSFLRKNGFVQLRSSTCQDEAGCRDSGFKNSVWANLRYHAHFKQGDYNCDVMNGRHGIVRSLPSNVGTNKGLFSHMDLIFSLEKAMNASRLV